MNCPTCSGRTAVLRSQPHPEQTRRRRCCTQCGKRFTTWEMPSGLIQVQAAAIAANRGARLLDRLQGLEQGLAALRQQLEADMADIAPVTCEQCLHWEGSCGLGMPDPEAEGLEFAAECSTFTEAKP